MKSNKNTIGRGLLVFFVIFGTAFLITACEKKETATMKTGSVHEEKEEEHGTVILSQEMQKSSGIEVKQVTTDAITVPLSSTAVIEMNMDKIARISPRISGKAENIVVSQGGRVKAGQVLAYIDSAEIDQIWAEYRKAYGKVDLARKNFDREETLFKKKISPEKDVLKARQELFDAEADINYARERFRLLGIDIGQFSLSGDNARHPFIPVASPLDGVVIEKAVTQGEAVNHEKVLFVVADLSTLWVIIDVYEKDMSRLKVGTDVTVSVAAFPDKVFKGKISYIADVVDEKTRTEKARVTIDNASGLLKPGMFATILTETRNKETERLIAVPEEAVQIDGATRYVFVQVSPEKFKKRDIETGRTLGKQLEVISGIKQGESIAVKGAFFLKSEFRKAELKGDEH
jgi:membrane fusion protein, heavy metal efflux system